MGIYTVSRVTKKERNISFNAAYLLIQNFTALKNSLKRLDIQENILEDSIFESRPEQLTIEEFIKLTKKVSNETI